jgi:hypothetical protein
MLKVRSNPLQGGNVRRILLRLCLMSIGVLCLMSTALVTPGHAASFNEPYYGPTNRYAGTLSFNDDSSPDVILGDFRDGYHSRLKVAALVDGTWYTYYTKFANDGLTNRFGVSSVPSGRLRFTICFYNQSWDYVGSCRTFYGYRR